MSLEERRQRKRVASVLDSEDAQQEAVEQEKYDAPDEHGSTLGFSIRHSRYFVGQADCAKGHKAV